MKRILCIALSLCLSAGLLAGCQSNEGGGDKAMGRYIEEQGERLEGIDRIFDLTRLSTGDGVFYAQDSLGKISRFVLSAAGGPLERTSVMWTEGLGMIQDLSEEADGTVYALSMDDGGRQHLYRTTGGAAPQEINIAEWEPEEGMADTSGAVASPAGAYSVEGDGSVGFSTGGADQAMGIRALPNDELLILYGSSGISHHSGADGTRIRVYVGWGNRRSLAVNEGTLLIPDLERAEINAYELATGNLSNTFSYDNLNFTTLLSMDQNGIIVADNTGIYRQSEGGSVWERLVEGGLTTLSMPTVRMAGLAPDAGDGFYAIIQGDSDLQMMHYVYSADTPSTPDTELSIFSLRENTTVRQAISEFQRRNPNVRINYRVGLSGDSSATAEDLIRTLNTELVAGKGPDLLLLDGLPIDSYIEKGVLVDLSGIVDKLSQDQGLMENLMGAYERNGSVYGIPARFSFPIMLGRTEALGRTGSLQALLEQVQQGQGGQPPFLYPGDSLWRTEGVIMNYYDACSGQFMNPDGTINEAGLSGYLEAMTELDRVLKEHTPEEGAFSSIIVSVTSSGAGAEILDVGASMLKKGEALFHIQNLSGRFGLQNIMDNLGDQPGFGMDALFGGDLYTPVGGIGIVSASKQQELSRSFIELLLSQTVQDNYLYDGFPVNGASLEKMVTELSEEAQGGDMGFMALCERLNTPILADQIVKDAVQAQAAGLLDGCLTPQQAAAEVVEKTRLYLTE